MATTIRRDPFARFDAVRRSVRHGGDKDCAWCGSKGRSLKQGYSLYQYGTDPDSISPRTSWGDRLFCGVSCWESFHA